MMRISMTAVPEDKAIVINYINLNNRVLALSLRASVKALSMKFFFS
jgi:hypothetical protein